MRQQYSQAGRARLQRTGSLRRNSELGAGSPPGARPTTRSQSLTGPPSLPASPPSPTKHVQFGPGPSTRPGPPGRNARKGILTRPERSVAAVRLWLERQSSSARGGQQNMIHLFMAQR